MRSVVGLISHPGIEHIQAKTQDLRAQIIQHPLYTSIHTLEHLQLFMQFHVYAVWDFMTLLKSLQQKLTGITLPWVPTGDTMSRRLINEIVFIEESDIDEHGHPVSHFELYLQSMASCGASTADIEALLERVRSGKSFTQILSSWSGNESIHRFLKNTWDLVDKAPLHEVSAVFALAREGLIPDMFMSIIATLKIKFPDKLHDLYYYLERHIHVDNEQHAPMAFHMLAIQCQDDQQKWDDAVQAVREALQARLTLWDGALAAIQSKS
jgi:hypothetical protein